MYEGGPKKPPWDLFIKNCVFILTCLNFSHLQSALHLMQYIYQDIFSTAQNSFLSLCILRPFSASAACLFLFFSTSATMFPFGNFFFLGKQTKR